MVRQDLVARAQAAGAYLKDRLHALAARSPLVGDVRGLGLLGAIELVADKASRRALPVDFNAPARLTEHGLRHGIALYNRRANRGEFGDFQMITPPLTASDAELDLLVELLERALADLHDEVRGRGLA